MEEKEMLALVSSALFENNGLTKVGKNTYVEMNKHAILSLVAPILNSIEMDSEIRKEWMNSILIQVSYNARYKFIQDNLPITSSYVIIKGTTAAQYYPHPEYRTLGDIDIFLRVEDVDYTLEQLTSDGYVIIQDLDREIKLHKNGIIIELHRRFASINDPARAKYIDDLIRENISPSHILPDLINGMVLLEHIDQHLEAGIGLRQIIDWMMFVHKCLPDEKWPEFKIMAHNAGLEKLAMSITRMCELYMGLPPREWASSVDEKLCCQLLEYILSCGNFGNKRINDSSITENVFIFCRTPKAAYRLLQERGCANWAAAQKHKALEPFAWIYQLCRYVRKGVNRKDALSNILMEYKAAKRTNAMFDALGVRQVSKGRIVYKDEKYRFE